MTTLYTPPDPQDITVMRRVSVAGEKANSQFITCEQLERAHTLANTVVEQGKRIRSLEATVQALLNNLENQQ